jgi:hypothetical protein
LSVDGLFLEGRLNGGRRFVFPRSLQMAVDPRVKPEDDGAVLGMTARMLAEGACRQAGGA